MTLMRPLYLNRATDAQLPSPSAGCFDDRINGKLSRQPHRSSPVTTTLVYSNAAGYTCAILTALCNERAALVATSANTPTLWNPLALVSFLLSLVFPVGVSLVQLAGGIFQPVNASTPSAYHIGVALLIVGILTVPLAIFTGHAALDWVRHCAYRWPLRGVAIVSLVLGYGALVAYFGHLPPAEAGSLPSPAGCRQGFSAG